MTAHAAPGPIVRLLGLVVDTVRSPVVMDGEVHICDWDHARSFVVDLNNPRPLGRLHRHLDVTARVHNRGGQLLTVIGVARATARGQSLFVDEQAEDFNDVTLEPGGRREEVVFALAPAHGQQLEAAVGDSVELRLPVTRGGLRAPRIRLRITGDTSLQSGE